MKKMTLEALERARCGESKAAIKYHYFAEKAQRENFLNIARAFLAISRSEQLHTLGCFSVLETVKTTAENIANSLKDEQVEIDELYPALMAIAEAQGEKNARWVLNSAYQAEKVHSKLLQRAQKAVEASSDMEISDIFVCSICGYTMFEDVPDKCPICNVGRDKFDKF